MEIIFENGEMIITHPSGHIDIYNNDNLQAQLNQAVQIKALSEDMVTDIETNITNLTASM